MIGLIGKQHGRYLGCMIWVVSWLMLGMGLQFECARVLHDSFFVPVHIYGSETMIWKEKERSRIRPAQMDTSEVCWVSIEWIKSILHG